jgi:hypothetical protein
MLIWIQSRPSWRSLYKKRNVEPQNFWEKKMRSKYWSAWVIYIQHKVEKNRRYKEAEGWRNDLSLKSGVLAWMRAADVYKRNRIGHSLALNVAQMSDRMKRVHKFATLWRSKTLAARARRLGSEGNNLIDSKYSLSYRDNLALRRTELARKLLTKYDVSSYEYPKPSTNPPIPAPKLPTNSSISGSSLSQYYNDRAVTKQTSTSETRKTHASEAAVTPNVQDISIPMMESLSASTLATLTSVRKARSSPRVPPFLR